MAPPLPRRALVVAIAALLVLAAAAELDAGSGRWAAEGHQDGVAMPAACRVEEDGEACGGEAATQRRRLSGGNYIGYDALRRNAVPCSYRGASYYNCRPGGQANPYSRGCSSITQCRG